ncbi:MAG: hypothetical protein ACRBDI_03045 [Alphaproteobacteria bacterium]
MGYGYYTLANAKGPGKWEIRDDQTLKAYFQPNSFAERRVKALSMTHDELKEMQAELYRVMTSISDELFKIEMNNYGSDSVFPTLREIKLNLDYSRYEVFKNIVDDTLSDNVAILTA